MVPTGFVKVQTFYSSLRDSLKILSSGKDFDNNIAPSSPREMLMKSQTSLVLPEQHGQQSKPAGVTGATVHT